MDENVRAIFLAQEAVALICIKPLDSASLTLCHLNKLLKKPDALKKWLCPTHFRGVISVRRWFAASSRVKLAPQTFQPYYTFFAKAIGQVNSILPVLFRPRLIVPTI